MPVRMYKADFFGPKVRYRNLNMYILSMLCFIAVSSYMFCCDSYCYTLNVSLNFEESSRDPGMEI